MDAANLKTKAVIFDMDGVLVDSEPLWQKAEFEIFSSLGVQVTEELALITKTMTTKEVTEFWRSKCAWEDISDQQVADLVISRVIELIENENCQIEGIENFVKLIKNQGYKIGLATNSPYRIIPVVLKKLKLAQYFDAVSSSDSERNGKPDPSVYLTTCRKLEVEPEQCAAIEDSYSGMLAAKRAGMKVVAFTNGNTGADISIANDVINNFRHIDQWPAACSN
ncbi:hexitol phosphatase HxpB [Flavobacterium sp. S87F.05.LMB.W.Kidney.N]|uniref:hexitol phosphatase HxpB n=1 Tax=Flavobacterium sp. S87F.05.LMB.W.Kidney.N TaxID=1278758 RepID=UPI0010667C61|nr:hexitol phosphatase HxpB [Flavobacterium sp. S87F.05.LMB.W.Kidney.N]TDX09648.1 sugar-phosphatase [Flavobacterium sp. S87F.05.LMB.W.Kidney.N]